MRKSNGFILLETLLALNVMVLICLTLLPMWKKVEDGRSDINKQLKASHILYENLQHYYNSGDIEEVVIDKVTETTYITKITLSDIGNMYMEGCVSYWNSKEEEIEICDVIQARTRFYLD